MAVDGYTLKERIELLASTIAEQFGGIISQLDQIERKLDEKASNSRVAALERRLTQGEERIGKIELAAAGIAAVSKFQRWLVSGVIVAGVGSVATLVYLASGGH